MRTALDTNIVSGLVVGDAKSVLIGNALKACRHQGQLIISPVVFSELLARPNLHPEFLTYFLERTQILVAYPMQEAVWTLAGVRFAQHARRRQKQLRQGPRRIVPDFLIGAHALTYADRLMTLDTTFYKQDFPELPLYPIHTL